MINFEFHNPVKILFGKGQIAALSGELASAKKIMVTYGGGSIKKNGVYDQVSDALKDKKWIEFGGIEANPQYTTLMKAVALAREEGVDYLLAVGGGSVLDGTKFIAAAIPFKGDCWEMVTKRIPLETAIPFSAVLTLPATGSEMNSGAVVSYKEIGEKRAFGNPLLYPKCSVLDPHVVASLPKRQIANGIVDAYVHVLEQYLTYPGENPLQERMAESILMTLAEEGPKVLEDPDNYEAAANLMWCATMALNGILRLGVLSDWATHMIGHELTAIYGIDHARTLAIIAPSLYRVMMPNKEAKLLQYGARVWGLQGTAEDAIKEMEAFFHSLGVPTKLSDYTEEKSAPESIAKTFEKRAWHGLGERQDIDPKRVKEIVEKAI